MKVSLCIGPKTPYRVEMGRVFRSRNFWNAGDAKSPARRSPPRKDGRDEGDKDRDEEQGRQDGIERDQAIQHVFKEGTASDGRRGEKARPERPQETSKT